MEILIQIFSPRFRTGIFLRMATAAHFATLLLLLIPAAPQTHAQTARDTDLKAVFLFNFAHFVDWPEDAFASESSPIVIAVLGEDPFGAALDEVVRAETVNQRPIVVERHRRLQDLGQCHILYISPSETDRQERIFAAVRGKPVLTVGETEGFAKNGGIIRFQRVENRINLVINHEAAKAARLRISSQVLRAATIVETPH